MPDFVRESSARAGVLDRMLLEHQATLARFVASRVSDPSEREDVVQEVCLRLARYDRIDDIDDPRAFLFRTAQNIIRDRARRAAHRRPDRHDPIDEASLADPTASPEQTLAGKEELARVVAAIKALDEPARTAFVLHRFEDMSYREIAAHMGVSTSTVDKYICLCLKRLRHVMGEQAGRASSSDREGGGA